MEKARSHRRASPREFQRTYKACVACRTRKTRCDLGPEVRPPCGRCRRQRRECIFNDDVGRKRRPMTTPSTARDVLGVVHPAREVNQLNVGIAHNATDDIPPLSPSEAHASGQNNHHQDVILGDRDLPFDNGNTGFAVSNSHHGTRQVPVSNMDNMQPVSLSSASGIANSVMRTVVSSGNDALNILFEAASAESNPPFTGDERFTSHGSRGSARPLRRSSIMTLDQYPAAPDPEVLKVWSLCRFVTMGWLTAKEAVAFIDLFFLNLLPQSPILSEYYASHNHHFQLITEEPMLCCTLLLLSSRYHILPGLAGMSKSYFLHNRLWKHWQGLMMRVMFGQEKGSETKMRTRGTIESLLMMTEWHPRSLHFPPEGDGWDSNLIHLPPDADRESEPTTPSNQWLEEVIEPARRSDRMSWMLLGSALSLAHELGVFDSQNRQNEEAGNGDTPGKINHRSRRDLRLQKLLHVFVNQLASRLGCTSFMPHSLNIAVSDGYSADASPMESEHQWDLFMAAWMGLTKLLKSVSDVFFPSAASTKQHLLSGRYIGLLDHFRPLLAQWKEKYMDKSELKESHREMLFIEYQFIRIFINSLGMQAVVERELLNSDQAVGLEDDQAINLEEVDYVYIQEVISGACQILKTVENRATSGTLRFSTVRYYLRVTSSSVFLLKALSLGVRQTQLRVSLDILERSIQALKSCTLDDMHLAPRYASLLETHVARLRYQFIISSKHGHLGRESTRPSHIIQDRTHANESTPGQAQVEPGQDMNMEHSLHDAYSEDWLSLPFDPSMAPFGLTGNQIYPGLEEGALDFVWNLSSIYPEDATE
ncbi:C6 transcription factor [Xylogone sp. PMI_703]|nr:C6 transcription factor [Xylogone sp. PMI_703]